MADPQTLIRTMAKFLKKIRTSSMSTVGLTCFAILLYGYLSFTALQGPYGIFQRIRIDNQMIELERELSRLQSEIDRMENLTHRLSDDYLDLDLLDERARIVLGYVGADELIIE